MCQCCPAYSEPGQVGQSKALPKACNGFPERKILALGLASLFLPCPLLPMESRGRIIRLWADKSGVRDTSRVYDASRISNGVHVVEENR